jgi:hypothetical protein
VFALRIGTVKNSKNFFLVDGPARSMRIGAAKESTETRASSESGIGEQDYAKGSPFYQS